MQQTFVGGTNVFRARLWALVATLRAAHKLSETEVLVVFALMLGKRHELLDGRVLRPGALHFHEGNILRKTEVGTIAKLRDLLLDRYFAEHEEERARSLNGRPSSCRGEGHSCR